MATVDFYFDTMCPYAHQTSLWIREVQRLTDLHVNWKFFSLEVVNHDEGKKWPWDRDIAYGWTPLRVAAWLRRIDNDLCGEWYLASAHALHIEGRRPYEVETANELLASIGAPAHAWESALADATTHDDIRRDHEHAVNTLGGDKAHLTVTGIKLNELLDGPAGAVGDPIVMEIAKSDRQSAGGRFRDIRACVEIIAEQLIRLICLHARLPEVRAVVVLQLADC